MKRSDYKKSWFYKLCMEELRLRVIVTLFFVGLGLLSLIFLKLNFSIRSLIGLIVGAAATVFGICVIVKLEAVELTKLRKAMRSLGGDWRDVIGEEKPECIFGTFYLAPMRICMPGKFMMIPYVDITNFEIVSRRACEGEEINGYDAVFTLSDRSVIKADILKWKGFETGFKGCELVVRGKIKQAAKNYGTNL